MSRGENDALESAQHAAQAVLERVAALEAEVAGLHLERDRHALSLRSLTRRRDQARARLDARPGSGVVSVVGLCAGAALARLGWELRGQLIPDERVVFGLVTLAAAVALTLSRTHWFRAGLRW
ncbi:MAG: hypothetical protein INH41_25440 [Myxococcaceae bacterium]|nr:hypothetical protein [Myxococcaceae bacterium]MCA3015744.1 hypothetical protein [Myxococcaceae bacterium]